MGFERKIVCQLQNDDYEEHNLLIDMENSKRCNMYRICGGDYAGRRHLLIAYNDRPGGVMSSWYTDVFEIAYRLRCCQWLLTELIRI